MRDRTKGPLGTSMGRRVASGLARLNARHPWSHNDHFHAWILSRLPRHRGTALDVGCGEGRLLEALAPHMEHVIGIDSDPDACRRAAARCVPEDGVEVRAEGFDEVGGRFDLITMVAVLHHLDLEPALERSKHLLAPEGRLLIVGLAAVETTMDRIWDTASAVTNPVIGMVKHPWPSPADAAPPRLVMKDPTTPLAEIRAAAERVLPGARIRRRLGFRYTLEWTAPDLVTFLSAPGTADLEIAPLSDDMGFRAPEDPS